MLPQAETPLVAAPVQEGRVGQNRSRTAENEISAQLRAIAPAMLACARRMFREVSDAEDVTQEALIAVAGKLGTLRNPAAAKRYGVTTVVRVALRHRKRKQRLSVDAGVPVEQIRNDTSSADLEQKLERRNRIERILTTLDSLDRHQQETMLLRFVEGYTIDEIADATAVSPNTVLSRIRLAKQHLRRRLEASGTGGTRP